MSDGVLIKSALQNHGRKFSKQFVIATSDSDNNDVTNSKVLSAPGENKRWKLGPVLCCMNMPASRSVAYSVEFWSGTAVGDPTTLTSVSAQMPRDVVRSTQAPVIIGEVNAPVYAVFTLDSAVPSGTAVCSVEFHAEVIDA